MKKNLRCLLMSMLVLFSGSALAATVTDELTWEGLGLNGSNNSYAEYSNIKISSSAVYACQASSGTGKYIQMRSSNSNSGIITTTSGGKLKSVTVTFNASTTDRSLSVYAKNSAYASATDLYSADNQGTKLGDIAANADSKKLTVEGDYEYVGLRSLSGAIYIDKIEIEWESSSEPSTQTATTIEFAEGYEQWFAPDGPFDETYPVATATVKAEDAEVAGASITWTVAKKDDWVAADGEGELTISDGKVTGINKRSYGTLTLTASFAGDQTFKPSTKSYSIKVCRIPTSIHDLYEWYGNKKEQVDKGMPVCYFQIDLDENDNPTPRQELVTYVKGSSTYITDGKQGMQLYKKDLGLAVGDKITVAGVTKADPIWGTLKSYNGTLEIEVDHMGVAKASTNNAVTPIEITVDKIATLDNFFTNWQGGHMTPLIENVFLNNYVTIKDAEYVGTVSSNEQFKVGDTNFLVYKNGANITFEETAKYTLTGVGSSYNKNKDITPQLNYISSEKTAEPAGINAIQAEAQQGKVYNLQGQRVEKATKGLYIVGDKKIVVK